MFVRVHKGITNHMLKRAEQLGLRLLSGKPTEDKGRPQERDRARALAKGKDYWAKLHIASDRREGFAWADGRKNHHQIELTRAPSRD